MYCKKCGQNLSEAANFCSRCRYVLVNDKIYARGLTSSVTSDESELPAVHKQPLILLGCWVALNMLFLYSNYSAGNRNQDYFWPFSSASRLNHYDVTEFLVYSTVPLVAYCIFSFYWPRQQDPRLTGKVYDLSYKPSDTGLLLSVFVYIVSLLFILHSINKKSSYHYRSESEYELARTAAAIIFSWIFTISTRICLLYMVIKTARRQNRDVNNWGVAAFIAPVLTMLILSHKRKLLD